MDNSSSKCAHDRCTCVNEPNLAVTYEGKTFCSERCADGRGCDHHGCNCGEFPTDEPERTSAVARQSAS